ncbi:5-bromo-4-chloroindolyl phosphate hydrolysis family protein [Thermoclostridium caenicola]|uniref:5-bromo-4-chloroindolyl phosphate hydrolysis family protein n=1 Tax=Thermoclostridium caenicola TaxID=659425 RepID=UPI00122C8928|nr:5-bromo-4-chloroindolyl phosphate hydrolysis family protein [Thermoclostridium caenicola]HPU22393.1 5-bromo-4-chloroindolyl phosphate hydrolysis family protein [Thermoclostridium caenicola]
MNLKGSWAGRLLSILIGVACFAVLNFWLAAGFFPALIVGVLAWLVAALINSGKQKEDKISLDGITRQEVESTIRAGRKLTAGMRQASYRLQQLEVKKEIEDLCKIAESMFELLKKDPNDLRIVKQFITYYLEPTHKIVLKYVELATTRPMPADAVSILDKTEKSFKTIRATFLQQKEKMLANDVMDLDTEIKVFETISSNMNTGGNAGKDRNTPSMPSGGRQ